VTTRACRAVGHRRVDPAISARARDRRALAKETALRLAQGGVMDQHIYASVMHDTMLDLASEGALRDTLGRPRRRWSGYADQAHVAQARWGIEYALFCERQGFSRVVQVVVRSPDSRINLGDLHAEHARQSARLSEKLRYGRARFAPGFACDIIAAEIRPIEKNGDVLDFHFHLAVRASAGNLMAMAAYFSRSNWNWWNPAIAADAELPSDPGQLASYLGKGLAHALKPAALDCAFSPGNLAVLHQQSRGLAMTRTTGAFRVWKAEVACGRKIAVQDQDGRIVLRPRRPGSGIGQFGERLRAGTGLQLLRFCHHDFGDGIRRPALLVRGRETMRFAEVAEFYDVSSAIEAARVAVTDLLLNTAIREGPMRSNRSAGTPSVRWRPG